MWEEMMQDLAAVTGGKVFDAKKGSPLDDFEDERDFGQVARVVALRDRTTFLPAEDRKRLVVERSDALRAQAEVEKDEEMEATLRSRIAAISGGVGVIRVPVLTGGDYSDKRELYEDAYMAAFSAMSEGVLPGGGFALLRALYRIDGKVEGDIEPGFVSVGEALRAPVRVILSNGGVDPNKMVVEVIFKDDWRTVYDLRTKTIGDCVALGVLDSVRVVSTALENAAAEACLLVMTENFLYEEHDKHGNHSK
jgi:chaperonin GroEL